MYPDSVDLDRAAYFFEYELADALPDTAYEGLELAVAGWTEAWAGKEPPELRYRSAPGYLRIRDSRPGRPAGTYTFQGMLADIYVACSDRPTTAAAVRDRLGLRLPVGGVEEILAEFHRRGLMFLDGRLALALALPTVAGR